MRRHRRRNAAFQKVLKAMQVPRANEDRIGVPFVGFFDEHVRRITV